MCCLFFILFSVQHKSKTEKKVFERLKSIADQYDIFYSKKFVSTGFNNKPEYEIDFIITIPNKAILCLEVKGGIIHYSGTQDKWTQNGRNMIKKPDDQARSNCHALLEEFRDFIGDMPVGWGVCFPDVDLEKGALPTLLSKHQIFDAISLVQPEYALEHYFKSLNQKYPHKTGVKPWQYKKFKNDLLRDIGFVQVLSTKMKYSEEKFIELTEDQINGFKRIMANDKIITTGPAGSGKTIIAKTIAHDFIKANQSVLFLCYNRTLANKIRYDFDRNEENITVSTFHSLAKQIIDAVNPTWWDENKKVDDFFELEVPIQLEECLPYYTDKFDVVIIDEAQDFKEFWFELIFELGKPSSKQYIFMDELQDIFGRFTQIPAAANFMKYSLSENCRNTKSIVSYLSGITERSIKSFKHAPEGENIIIENFENQTDQQKYLLDTIKSLTREQGIAAEQILILINSSKTDSCISGTTKAGRLKIEAVGRNGSLNRGSINYSTINTFKGLEADIVFILDTHLIAEANKTEMLYTQASRAKHKLYLLGC